MTSHTWSRSAGCCGAQSRRSAHSVAASPVPALWRQSAAGTKADVIADMLEAREWSNIHHVQVLTSTKGCDCAANVCVVLLRTKCKQLAGNQQTGKPTRHTASVGVGTARFARGRPCRMQVLLCVRWSALHSARCHAAPACSAGCHNQVDECAHGHAVCMLLHQWCCLTRAAGSEAGSACTQALSRGARHTATIRHTGRLRAGGADLRSSGGVTELLLGECWMRPRLQERLACPLAARPSRALGLLVVAGSTHTTSQHRESADCAMRSQMQPCKVCQQKYRRGITPCHQEQTATCGCCVWRRERIICGAHKEAVMLCSTCPGGW